MKRLTVFVALLLLVGAVSTNAQSLTGTIAGKVTDEQGGVLPGVTVTLLARTGAQATVTDEKGEYRFVGLNPGPYEVKAELSGFTPRTERGLDLGIGRTLSVPFTLRVGGLAETVDVVANASTVDTKTTASDNSLSQDLLSNIPINMGNFNVATQPVGARGNDGLGISNRHNVNSTDFGLIDSTFGAREMQIGLKINF